MKLISLYIENFGGLSQYGLDFAEGLTVIEAENGFGKTTLAEFIRAMFYGFPRKGKTLDKSRRQKYTPWNGGKFGGNLVFEEEGVRYRLERSFGATPKTDTFSLIDLNTGKKSSRFTEDIGLELFGLDGDAFERSTYLPQMAEVGNLTTDSIRSKLSNLVEDTNDVGNFEKAVAALKAKRITYLLYKGNGGSVVQARSRVSQLQEQLQQAEAAIPRLESCSLSIGELEHQIEELQTACDEIRSRIRRASEGAAITAAHRQEAALRQELEKCCQQLEQLREKYPAGIPGAEKLDQARQTCARMEVLKDRNVTDAEDLEAEAFLRDHQHQFAQGIPSREELDEYRNVCKNYFALLAEADGKGLSQSEKEQDARLEEMFRKGLLEKERLERLTDMNREWTEKGHQRAVLELSEEEFQKKQALEGYFAVGVPDEMSLRQKQSELEQLRQMRQEQSRRISAATQLKVGSTSPVLMILCLVLGIACVAAGGVLLGQSLVWGIIGLSAGALSLLGSVFAGIRMKKNRTLEKVARAEQDAIRRADEQIRNLKDAVSGFAVAYSTSDMMGAALYEIRDNREDYLALLAKEKQLLEKKQTLDEKREALEQILRRELGEGDFAAAITNLHVLREQHLELGRQKIQAAREASGLREEAAKLLEKIHAVLNRYGIAEREDLHSGLSTLERDADTYTRAQIRVLRWYEAQKKHGAELAACTEELAAFFEEFAMKMEPDTAAQLLQIRDDRKDLEELTALMARQERALQTFREENEFRLAEKLPEMTEDPEQLREEEMLKNRQLRETTETLLQLQQEQRQLKAIREQIPVIQEDLQLWQDRKNADQHCADILDDTVAFLEQAKENLSTSYMGPIRGSFNGYLNRLWKDQAGKTLVNQDLEVQLERYGESRELGYFSAGQADLVMLCMRFALVDALFGEESPCVILDDPFVNLDDLHTKQALELLAELARSRQILYLTCSTSRTPN